MMYWYWYANNSLQSTLCSSIIDFAAPIFVLPCFFLKKTVRVVSSFCCLRRGWGNKLALAILFSWNRNLIALTLYMYANIDVMLLILVQQKKKRCAFLFLNNKWWRVWRCFSQPLSWFLLWLRYYYIYYHLIICPVVIINNIICNALLFL